MIPRDVPAKWRPTLGLVVVVVLTTVMALPLSAFLLFRLYEKQLVPGSAQAVIALAALVVIGATLAIGYLFWRTITGPLHALAQRAEQVGHGADAIAPLKRHGTQEIALLAQSFADMAARLRQRSDTIETFAAHVSHEMKTPLTSILGAAELLRDDAGGAMPDERRRKFIDNIVADAARLTALLQRLRDLARAETLAVGGRTLLAPAVNDLQSAFPTLAISLEDHAAVPLAISAENLGIALAHLADNAARHGARQLHLSAEFRDAHVALLVRDDGGGISEGNRDRIFDAFFTTRRETGGTGMGLGIVRAILRAHSGGIELDPRGPGTTFRITLPTA